jgi:hypothetical protein
MDRPRNVEERLASMVPEGFAAFEDRLDLFGDRPPEVARTDPDAFAAWVRASGASVVIIDDLKGVWGDFRDTTRATLAAMSMSALVREGIDVLGLTHTLSNRTKPQAGEGGLEGIYGGSNLFHGAGTVCSLYKSKKVATDGRPVIDLVPHKLGRVDEWTTAQGFLNPDTGRITTGTVAVDTVGGILGRGGWWTKGDVAEALDPGNTPDNPAKKRIARELERLVATGEAESRTVGDHATAPKEYRTAS